MGKQISGILGPYTGKIGNVVGGKWRGRYTTRVYTSEVANPNTEKQQQVRARFAELAKLASAMKCPIDMGFYYPAKSQKVLEQNVFFTENWRAVLATSVDDVIVNYSELLLSKGPLPSMVPGTADWGSTEHLTLNFPFTANIGQGCGGAAVSATDEIYVYIYSEELEQGMLSSSALASGSSVTMTVPNAWSGIEVHAWMFLIGRESSNALKACNSVYIGHGEIQ